MVLGKHANHVISCRPQTSIFNFQRWSQNSLKVILNYVLGGKSLKVHLLRIQSLGFTETGEKGTFGALQNYICDHPVFHLLGAYQKLPKEENRTTHEYHSRLPHHLFSNVNHGIPWLVIDLFFGEGGASCKKILAIILGWTSARFSHGWKRATRLLRNIPCPILSVTNAPRSKFVGTKTVQWLFFGTTSSAHNHGWSCREKTWKKEGRQTKQMFMV